MTSLTPSGLRTAIEQPDWRERAAGVLDGDAPSVDPDAKRQLFDSADAVDYDSAFLRASDIVRDASGDGRRRSLALARKLTEVILRSPHIRSNDRSAAMARQLVGALVLDFDRAGDLDFTVDLKTQVDTSRDLAVTLSTRERTPDRELEVLNWIATLTYGLVAFAGQPIEDPPVRSQTNGESPVAPIVVSADADDPSGRGPAVAKAIRDAADALEPGGSLQPLLARLTEARPVADWFHMATANELSHARSNEGPTTDHEGEVVLANALVGALSGVGASGFNQSRAIQLAGDLDMALGKGLDLNDSLPPSARREYSAALSRASSRDRSVEHDGRTAIYYTNPSADGHSQYNGLRDLAASVIYGLSCIAAHTADSNNTSPVVGPGEQDRATSADGLQFDEQNHDVVGAPPLREMLTLEVNPEPTPEHTATLIARLETLLMHAERLIDNGAFDSDPERLSLVERDLNFLRAEAFETGEPFLLGKSMAAIIARLERNIMAVIDAPDNAARIVDRLIDTTDQDDPEVVADLLDDLIDAANLEDPEWLASQTKFDAYSDAIDDITARGARQWLVDLAHRGATDQARQRRGDLANSAQIGGVLGGAVGLFVATLTAATYTEAAEDMAMFGAIVGVAISWMLGRWRPSNTNE